MYILYDAHSTIGDRAGVLIGRITLCLNPQTRNSYAYIRACVHLVRACGSYGIRSSGRASQNHVSSLLYLQIGCLVESIGLFLFVSNPAIQVTTVMAHACPKCMYTLCYVFAVFIVDFCRVVLLNICRWQEPRGCTYLLPHHGAPRKLGLACLTRTKRKKKLRRLIARREKNRYDKPRHQVLARPASVRVYLETLPRCCRSVWNGSTDSKARLARIPPNPPPSCPLG